MKKIYLCLIIFCQLFYLQIWAQDLKKYEVFFDKSDFEFLSDDAGLTHIIPNKLNYTLSGDTTQPALPYSFVSFLIPQDAEVADYTFSFKSEKMLSEIIIAPCSPVLTTNSNATGEKVKRVSYTEKKYPINSVTINPATICRNKTGF